MKGSKKLKKKLKKASSLNKSYNLCYNLWSIKMWIEEWCSKVNRKTALIWFHPHIIDRSTYWQLEKEKIKQTVRDGKIVIDKCEEPNKICFAMYFGKENISYCVITRFHDEFIEVITAWPKIGR